MDIILCFMTKKLSLKRATTVYAAFMKVKLFHGGRLKVTFKRFQKEEEMKKAICNVH